MDKSITLRARRALAWGATAVAYPVGGLAAMALGPVASPPIALAAGAIVGTCLGGAQALTKAVDATRTRWILATAVGQSLGLALGASAVGFAVEPPAVLTMGAIAGVCTGAAQALVARWSVPRRLVWVLASAVAAAAGWATTALVGVDLAPHFASFGASGALVSTVLSGLTLMLVQRPKRRPVAPRPVVAAERAS